MSTAEIISLLIAGVALALGLLNTLFIYLQHRRENKRYAQDQKDRSAKKRESELEATKTVLALDTTAKVALQHKPVNRVSRAGATNIPKANPVTGFYIMSTVIFRNDSKTPKTVKIDYAGVQYDDGGRHSIRQAQGSPRKVINVEPLAASDPIDFKYVVDDDNVSFDYPRDFHFIAGKVRLLLIKYEVIGHGEYEIEIPIRGILKES